MSPETEALPKPPAAPTTRSPLVTSTPLPASTLPAKVTWPPVVWVIAWLAMVNAAPDTSRPELALMLPLTSRSASSPSILSTSVSAAASKTLKIMSLSEVSFSIIRSSALTDRTPSSPVPSFIEVSASSWSPPVKPVKAPAVKVAVLSVKVSEVIEVVPASVIAPSPKVNLLVAPPMVRLSVDVVIEVAASTVIASLNWSKSRESSAIWPPVITPEPFMISVPATTKALSQPLPMLRALSAASVPVSAPTSTAFKVTSASPVRASMAMRLAVFVPAVALPISASMFNRLWMFVPAESAGVVEANSTDDDVPESALLA